MAADEKWYFSKEHIMSAPSRKYGYDVDKELSCRQQAANFIQDMGQRLQVTQLCINTAIVYMHRFYMFHSFSRFHRNAIAAAALFLAAKVEEQPRKLEHVIKVAQICLHRDVAPPDVKSETYMEQAQELVVNENILLQTLGFDVGIDHPHTHVVRCCQLVRASKDLAQTSYFMASNSLHLTTMCLQYKPTVVACFCIHLACKWSNWEIPQSTEGKPWFWYIDKSVTQDLLEQLTEEFLAIFEKCPSRLKKKIVSLSQNQNPTILSQFNSNKDDKKRNGEGPSAGLFPTGCSLSTAEEMKKKQEFQRHHPEYKKHHMSTTHHSRPEPTSVPSKSSCMFGPPQRTQPSSHSSVSSSHQSRSITKSAAPEGNIGKPEHLHHRPRRPEDKHPRNHDHIPPPYKKFDSKVPSGVVNEFPQPGSNPNSRSGMYNTTSSSYQMAQHMAPQAMHPPALPEQNLPVPAQPSAPKIAPIPPRVKTPPPIKIERSIFSPEKCTPPPENIIKPLPRTPPPVAPAPNLFQKVVIKEEPIIKLEPITPIEVKQEVSISPKEEKPPDLNVPIEQPTLVEVPSLAPPQSQPEEHTSHKESKKHKKEKKKHKEHKEKHKDKHKHKHKNRESEQTQQRGGEGLSLVIKIPKEQINLEPTPPPERLKIKIARDKITTPKLPVESPLKIKISQGKIKESKKRDRSEERSPGLPAKYHRANGTTTLQVNNVDVVDCSNIKQEYDKVEIHSPPSVQFDVGGNLIHSPPSINFGSDPVKQEFATHSPPSVVQSPPSVHIDEKMDLGIPEVLSPPSMKLGDGIASPPLANLESEFKGFLDSPPKSDFGEIQHSQPANEKRVIDGVTVEVHSPPSVNFDDSDLGEELLDVFKNRASGVKPEGSLKTVKSEEVRRNSPLPLEIDSNRVGAKQESFEDGRRAGSYNHWNKPDEFKSNFAGRGGILYRARGRGAFRPPRAGLLYRDFPNRPQWAPRPPGDCYRGVYRGGYNQQPRPAVRHQFQHQRVSQPRPRMTPMTNYRHYTDTKTMSQSHQYPDAQNMTQLQFTEHQKQQQYIEQQHYAGHYAQLQQHYFQAQQALYASQFAHPPPPSSNKPPLPDGPPPDKPPPPPPE